MNARGGRAALGDLVHTRNHFNENIMTSTSSVLALRCDTHNFFFIKNTFFLRLHAPLGRSGQSRVRTLFRQCCVTTNRCVCAA